MKKLTVIGFIFALTALSIFGFVTEPQAKEVVYDFKYTKGTDWTKTFTLDSKTKITIENTSIDSHVPVNYTITKANNTATIKGGSISSSQDKAISLTKGKYTLTLNTITCRCMDEHILTGTLTFKR